FYKKEWGNRGHSPIPVKITDPENKNYNFSDDKENFAYIMKLCTGYASDSYWKGFGHTLPETGWQRKCKMQNSKCKITTQKSKIIVNCKL
ncbi:MAG: hypothetical protein AB1297_06195, partial [bacterium]